MKITSINFHPSEHGTWFGTATDGRNLRWFYSNSGTLSMDVEDPRGILWPVQPTDADRRDVLAAIVKKSN